MRHCTSSVISWLVIDIRLSVIGHKTKRHTFEADVDYGSLDEDSSAISDIDFLSDDDYDYYEFSGGSDFSDYDFDSDPDYYGL